MNLRLLLLALSASCAAFGQANTRVTADLSKLLGHSLSWGSVSVTATLKGCDFRQAMPLTTKPNGSGLVDFKVISVSSCASGSAYYLLTVFDNSVPVLQDTKSISGASWNWNANKTISAITNPSVPATEDDGINLKINREVEFKKKINGPVVIGTPLPAPTSLPVVNSANGYYENGVKITAASPAMAPIGPATIATPPKDPDFQPDSLLAAYDFTTRNGNTVYDISGNGNHGTAVNVTFDSKGANFNGTSAYIAVPPVVGSQQFTAIIVGYGPNTTLTAAWSETKTGDGGTLILAGNWSDKFYYRDAANNAAIPNIGACCLGSNVAWVGPNYHAQLVQYSGSAFAATVLDVPTFTASASAAGVSIAGTDTASIGARTVGASHDLYWTGSLAYLAIWKGTFTAPQIARIYSRIQVAMAARAVRLPVQPLGVQTAIPNLVRQGVVITRAQEPNVLYESGCLAVASPCFKIWHSVTTGFPTGDSYEAYQESVDGLTWTLVGSTGVPGQSSIIHVGSTYYLYTSNGGAGNFKQLTLWTSADGFHDWSNQGTVITPSATATDPDSGGVYNSNVSYDPTDGWKMLYECGPLAQPSWWHLCYATSRDGRTWTKSALSPLNGWANGYSNGYAGTPFPAGSGPDIHKINGQYWVFSHNGIPPSNLYLSYWGDGTGMITLHPASAILSRGAAADETGTYAQVADPSVVEVNGKTYIFYAANDNGNGSATAYDIKLAIADMPLAQFVTTKGGATATTP